MNDLHEVIDVDDEYIIDCLMSLYASILFVKKEINDDIDYCLECCKQDNQWKYKYHKLNRGYIKKVIMSFNKES